ncbi:MAG: HEAT repeat domain-containing protein [Deltaproteobacteria bacterium]|nr:HEAT repeat domain-containing protein [Deltaproteobacteria bacterium]
MKDYYRVLTVTPEASSLEITKAYRMLAFQYHPDLNSGKNSRMAEINEAYSVLSTPDRRGKYDRSLAASVYLRKPAVRPAQGKFNPRMKGHLKAMVLNRAAGLQQIPALMEIIACDDNPVTCFAVKDLLVCYGRKAAIYLQSYLTDSHQRVRYFALLAINEIGRWPPEHRLVALLNDSSSKVRLEAVQALGASRADKTIPHLKLILKDRSLGVRLAVVEVLAELGGPEAALALSAGLEDPKARVRIAAAKALGSLGQPATAEPLTRALSDDNPYVSRAARQALRRLRSIP